MVSACEPLNLIFKQAEQAVSEGLIRKRNRPSNGYWGKVPQDGTFPTNQGTSIKGLRLPRIGMNLPEWAGVNDTLCETNLCDNPAREVVHSGHPEEYFYTVQRTAFRSDWICLDAMIFRDIPDEELAHFEEGLQERTGFVWDDKYRVEYIHHSENKIMTLVPRSVIDDGICDCFVGDCDTAITTDAFTFEMFPDQGAIPGQVNPNHILVNIDPSDLDLISELSVDMLEEAQLALEWDDENMPAIGEGIDLFDVVLPHKNMGRKLMEQEDQAMNNSMSYGGFEASKLKRLLGTKHVLRDTFSLRYDTNAMRFYPDDLYNSTLGAYDANDQTTWPRLFRVYPYRPVANPLGGISWIPNQYYRSAPFGIAVMFTPKVITGLAFPEITSIGSAHKMDEGKRMNYAGRAVWLNPEWECNMKRNKGFWFVELGMAVKENRPEFGYVWLVRIDHKISLKANCCPLPPAPCFEDVSPYCTPDGDSFGQNRVVAWNGQF